MVLNTQDDILEQIGEENNLQGKMVDQKGLELIKNSKKCFFSLIHFNIRSLNKNIDNLLTFIETYNLHYIDIIVLTETFQIDSIKNCNIPNYQLFYNKANYNKNDGTIILVKDHINVDFSFTHLQNSRATLSHISFELNDITFGLTAVYKPPPISKTDFVNDIYTYFENLALSNVEVFVGDVNINILEKKDNHVANYLSLMNTLGFRSYINSVTRSISKTCLDHLFINKKLKSNNISLDSYIVEEDITDHSPIVLLVSEKIISENLISPLENKNKTKLNINKFKQLLQNFDWTNVMNANDSGAATGIFLENYMRLLSEATEKYTVKYKKYKKIKSWISNGIVSSIKTRDKMKKKLLKNFSPQLEREYKEYRNTLNKLIHKQKNEYYKNQIENNKYDMKNLYNVIKDATYENNKKNNTFLNIKSKDDQSFNNCNEIANFCNEYYINVGVEMEKAIPTPQEKYNLGPPLVNSIFLNPITKNELINHISTLKNGSSPGYDGIKAHIIKQTHLEIIDPLLYIFNLIFETGNIPPEFKTSIITPIHKSGSKTNIINYRPVSLISNFGKLLEKCIKVRLVNFLKLNNILSPNQFGFLEGCSTMDAMHRLITEIVNNLNANKKCLTVFLDLAKAFDTVPHNGLLEVLENSGMRGRALCLFESYLSERTQMVKINNVLSEGQTIKIGVPQGTVLGPVLFITYINSLLKLQVDGITISYADDTALVISGDTWESVKCKTVNSMIKVRNWLQTFKLTLNLTKTHYIAFSLTGANRPQYGNIVVDDHCIEEISSTKYLGIVIDKFLKWQPHIDYVSGKIRGLIHKFYLLREFLNKRTLIIIYKAFVESIIGYGILVWGGLYNNSLYKLNIIQKYILKIIYRKKRLYPTRLLFNEEILSIRSIYILTVCSYVHTHNNLKLLVNHTYETRTRINRHIKLPISNNNLNLRYVNYFGPKLYNLLPGEVRNCSRVKTFKKLSRKVIFNSLHQFEGFFR